MLLCPMLKSLHIRNYALIDQLEVDWNNGLSCITGETGAGKSIIIGALQLLTGSRSDVKVLRSEDQKCVVEASFSCEPGLYKELLAEFELDDQGEIIIRREIAPNGKSRSFVNDSPRLLNELQSISNRLLSIHQQFDHLDFYDPKFQLHILDAYCGISSGADAYRSEYKNYQELKQKRSALDKLIQQSKNEQDFLAFQWNELQEAQLKSGELAQLENDLLVMNKAEDVRNYCMQCCHIINQENGIKDALSNCMSLLRSIRINSSLDDAYKRLESSSIDLSDLARQLEHLADEAESDPAKIQAANERLDQLNRLLKKHQLTSDDELIDLQHRLEEKLNKMDQSGQELEVLDREISAKFELLNSLANELSKKRKQASPLLAGKTVELLIKLGMEFARFEIKIEPDEQLNDSGQDLIEFLFSANKGNVLKPLKDQASGGELARMNLAIKSLVSGQSTGFCLIFDEIDTGVSGQIALQMGNILRDISKDQQVICITHSAQVASRAKSHYYVYKEHESEQSETKLKKLNEQEKLNELAKMLSGEPPTKAALKNAAELVAME